METQKELTKLEIAALILRRIIEPEYSDPGFDLCYKLLGKPFLEIAFIVLQQSDSEKRKKRLSAELLARPAMGDTFLQMVQTCDPAQDPENVSYSGVWQVKTIKDALEPLPPIEWLAKPYISRPSVSIFFSRPKSLKTFLLLDLALKIASGRAWLKPIPGKRGNGVAVKKTGVLWIDLENGNRIMHARLKALLSAMGVNFEDGNTPLFEWVSMPSPWPDLSDPEKADHLKQIIDAYAGDVGLIILDHFGQLLGEVDENSPAVTQIMGRIRTISELCNVAIILVHHQVKGNGKKGGYAEDQLRGHGSILANVDIAIQVKRDRINRDRLEINPVAVRGPDAPVLSAVWTYAQDEQLDLTEAAFWQVPFQSIHDKISLQIEKVLSAESVNQASLRNRVAEALPGIGDPAIRRAILSLEESNEIVFKKGKKNSKIYSLPNGKESQEDLFGEVEDDE